LDESPFGALASIDLGAIPAQLRAAGESAAEIERQDGHSAVLMYEWIDDFEILCVDSTAKRLVVSAEGLDSVDTVIDEGIEVDDVGRRNLEVPGWIPLPPTLEGSVFDGNKFVCLLDVHGGLSWGEGKVRPFANGIG
jgi:hypothetical protein